MADFALDDLAPLPFSISASTLKRQTPLRAAITRHYRAPEPHCAAALARMATLPDQTVQRARAGFATFWNVTLDA